MSEHPPQPRQPNIREIVCKIRDAVVTISGQIIYDEGSLITQRGNGFFIKGHYIICPSDLVLINPQTKLKRIPASTSEVVRVSRILVDVSNVNGSGQSYTYEADVVGIDGAANLAILRINPTNDWNVHNPSIRVCHPVLQWGKSRSSGSGDTIILIGNITAPIHDILPVSENAVTFGILSDNRYVFPTGHVPGELLLLSNVLPHGNQGLPIITTYGTVIGMTIHVHGSYSYNVGISEFFMRRSVKALIRTYQDKSISERYQRFITLVKDPIGDYYSFNKSWIGIAGVLMDAQDYNTTIKDVTRIPMMKEDSSEQCSNTLFNSTSCKEIVGYRVTSLVKGSVVDGLITPGDIITHLNGCPLGDRKGQISPSLVMWRIDPEDKVKISYRKQEEHFQHNHDIVINTQSYPISLDFPFYSRSNFSLQDMLHILL